MKFEKDLISVIIPIYNTEKWLKRCLDSVLNQTISNLEIICINDGSPDNSEEICLEYVKKDSRILYFKKENEGVSEARNFGVAKSSGKFIYFLDSDDWISQDYLQGFYDALQGNNADLAYNDSVTNVYNLKESIAATKVSLRSGVYKAAPEIFNKMRTPAWNKVYRKEFFVNMGISFERGLRVEDHLFQELMKPYVKEIAISKTGTYFYNRTAEHSFSNTIYTDKKRNQIDEVRVYEIEYDCYKSKGFLNQLEPFTWLLKVYCRLSPVNQDLCFKELKKLFSKFDDDFMKSRSKREIKFYNAVMQDRKQDLNKLFYSRKILKKLRVLARKLFNI